MALLGTYTDYRTIAGLTNGQSTSFAHGVGADPNAVIINFIATVATSNTVAMLSALHDATNITVRNNGTVTSPDFEVTTVRFHSIIR